MYSRRLPDEGFRRIDEELDEYGVGGPRPNSLSTWYTVKLGQGPSRVPSSGIETTVVDSMW